MLFLDTCSRDFVEFFYISEIQKDFGGILGYIFWYFLVILFYKFEFSFKDAHIEVAQVFIFAVIIIGVKIVILFEIIVLVVFLVEIFGRIVGGVSLDGVVLLERVVIFLLGEVGGGFLFVHLFEDFLLVFSCVCVEVLGGVSGGVDIIIII